MRCLQNFYWLSYCFCAIIIFEDDVMKMSAFSSQTQKNTWKYRIYDTTCSFKNVIQLLDIVSDIEME